MKSQVYSKSILFWSRLASQILSPYYVFLNLFRPSYSMYDINIKTIVVSEYHRIGDVLIIIPTLKMIKKRFPSAHLILICNYNVYELIRHMEIVDEVIPFRSPWTSWEWSIARWLRAIRFARKLSNRGIDLFFDFKGDFRNNWFLWNTKPKVSFGYNTTGGSYFLTNPYNMNQSLHQRDRSIELVTKANCKESHLIMARAKVNISGCVVFHPGASDINRFWPLEHWENLAALLSKKLQVCIVKVEESLKLIDMLKEKRIPVDIFEGDLVYFMTWLVDQRCLICPDSMAGHLASYVGIPVISIFGSQPPELTKPIGSLCKVVVPDNLCKHKREHWRLCRLCMESISPKKVQLATEELLNI